MLRSETRLRPVRRRGELNGGVVRLVVTRQRHAFRRFGPQVRHHDRLCGPGRPRGVVQGHRGRAGVKRGARESERRGALCSASQAVECIEDAASEFQARPEDVRWGVVCSICRRMPPLALDLPRVLRVGLIGPGPAPGSGGLRQEVYDCRPGSGIEEPREFRMVGAIAQERAVTLEEKAEVAIRSVIEPRVAAVEDQVALERLFDGLGAEGRDVTGDVGRAHRLGSGLQSLGRPRIAPSLPEPGRGLRHRPSASRTRRPPSLPASKTTDGCRRARMASSFRATAPSTCPGLPSTSRSGPASRKRADGS